MPELLDSMCAYIGQTVTIFTTSGGLSGGGFTGVLISADCNVVRLLADMGAPPACPVGSCCTGPVGGYAGGYYDGFSGGMGNMYGSNPLGAIVTIPIEAVAAFVHNAI